MVTPVSSPGGAPGGTEALRKQRLWGARQEAGRPQRRWGRVLARPCAAHGDAPRGDPRLLADRSEVLCGESAREGGQTSREAGPGCSGPWVLSTRARLSAGGHALVAPRLGPELIKPPRALEPDRWPPPELARGGAVGSHRWFLSPSPSVTHRQLQSAQSSRHPGAAVANHHNRVAGRNRRILLEPGGPSLESGCRGRAVLPARLRAAPPAPRPAPPLCVSPAGPS